MSLGWESPRVSRASLPARSDVAVVLGGLSDPTVSTPEHLEFNRAAERATEAVALYREGRVGAILVTSGSGELLDPGAVEAPGLAAWIRAQGVAADAVFVEDRSRNTRENATLSLPLARAHGWKSVVLITSAVHMPRSAAVFRRAGWAAEGRSLSFWPVDTQTHRTAFPFSLVPDPLSLGVVQSVLKERAGFLVYQLQGYL